MSESELRKQISIWDKQINQWDAAIEEAMQVAEVPEPEFEMEM